MTEKSPLSVLLAMGALLLLAGCHPAGEGGRKGPSLPEIPVRVVPVLSSGVSHEISVAGVIRGIHEALLTSRVGGQIESVRVRLGQRVTKGQLLLNLSNQTFEARKIRSEAALSYAKANFGRIDRLYRNGSASLSEYDRAKQSLDMATAEAQDAEAQLSWTRVLSPFSGQVSKKRVRDGDVVLPGTPLLSVVDATRLLVVAHVPDVWSSSLHPGLPVRFTFKGRTLMGSIRDLSPESDPLSHSITVKVLLKKEGPVPGKRGRIPGGPASGMYGKLFIPVDHEATLMVPAGTIIDHEGLREVFVVRAGHAELRYVRTGRTLGGRVEVLSGLSGGEEVVIHPPSTLADGAPVLPERPS